MGVMLAFGLGAVPPLLAIGLAEERPALGGTAPNARFAARLLEMAAALRGLFDLA